MIIVIGENRFSRIRRCETQKEEEKRSISDFISSNRDCATWCYYTTSGTLEIENLISVGKKHNFTGPKGAHTWSNASGTCHKTFTGQYGGVMVQMT